MREGVRKRLPGNVHAQRLRRNLALELGSEPRLEPVRVQRGIAERLAAERIEARGEMPVRAVSLDQRHGRRDGAQEVPGRCRGRCSAVAVLVQVGIELAQAFDERKVLDQSRRSRLEELSPLRIDRLRRVEVLGEELLNEP